MGNAHLAVALVSELYEAMTPMSTNRVILGFVAAWVTSAVVAFAAGCAFGLVLQAGHLSEWFAMALAGSQEAVDSLLLAAIPAAMTGSVVSLVAIICFAIPMYLAACRRQVHSRRGYALGGCAVGLLAFIALAAVEYTFTRNLIEVYLLELAAMLAAGPIASLTFWSIARPDRRIGKGASAQQT